MARHAILLADREWCEAASSGRVRVYDFIKPRKQGIRALTRGSVCVVLTKARAGQPQVFYGEFTVTEVREVDAGEYGRLAREGLIHSPQALKPGEKRWVLFFDEFREYATKPRKDELADVRTSTGRKPISVRVVTGLSYIDDQALEGIRRKAGGFVKRELQQPPTTFMEELEERISRLEKLLEASELPLPLTHECAELTLLRMGRQLGFKVYTADPSKICGNVRLGDLASMSRADLKEHAGPKVLESLTWIDVVWYREKEDVFYVFEVVTDGDMDKALLRLSEVGGLNVRMFIVSDESRRKEYEKVISKPTFSTIRNSCTFLSMKDLAKMFDRTELWKRSVEPLRLPYLVGEKSG